MAAKLPIGRARFEQDRLRRLSLQQQGQSRVAETVAQHQLQLEEYRNRLVTIIREHSSAIATDPVIRANVRQLAAAVNVQIAAFSTVMSVTPPPSSSSSSSLPGPSPNPSPGNIFSGIGNSLLQTLNGGGSSSTTNPTSLPADAAAAGGGGGGVFHAEGVDQLALDFMDVISAERKFFGGYVPLSNVYRQVARKRLLRAKDRGSSVTVDALEKLQPTRKELEDVVRSLRCLGNTALTVVMIDGSEYLQTSQQGTHTADLAVLVDWCLRQQQQQQQTAASQQQPGEGAAASPSFVCSSPLSSSSVVGWTREVLMKEMNWNEKRLEAALRGLLLNGSMWIDGGAPDHLERFFLLRE